MANDANPAGSSFRTQSDALAEDLAALLEVTPRAAAAEEVLQMEGDTATGIFFVRGGWLVVSKYTEDGKRQIIDFVLPGEVFDPGSATNRQASADLAALTEATVSVIPHDVWARLLRERPDLRKILDRRNAAGFSRIAERLLRIGKSHAEARIAYAICELCLRSTRSGLVDGVDFSVPLTQQVLGDFVGLTSVHVSRTLRRLKRQAVLGAGDQMNIVIHDVDRLAEIAEIDLDELRAEIIPPA